MKSIYADLLGNVGTVYDQNRTTIIGRIVQKLINSKQVLGPNLNKFIDLTTDSGIAGLVGLYASSNNRVFTCTAEANGLMNIVLHTYNPTNGNVVYNGRLIVLHPDLPITTAIIRSMKVIDEGTTNWKIFITNTANVLTHGGTYCVNNIALTDFVPVGPATIPFATGDNQKAVYFLQDPSFIGVNQLQIASAGLTIDKNNNKIYVHNGTSAIHQYYVYNTNVPLTMDFSNVTIDETTDVISHAGHTFSNDDRVSFRTLVGAAPLVVNAIYFVRDVVAGVSYRLSSTSGGAAINITTAGSGEIIRGYGITGSAWSHKTGNLPSVQIASGTLLLTDSEDYALPNHTINIGEPCVFFATTTRMFLGKLSELTPGATSWPSLVEANLLGGPNQIVAPITTHAAWSSVLDCAVIATAGPIYIMKKMINNEILKIFGGNNNLFLEGINTNIVPLSPAVCSSLDIENGILFVLNGTTTGQRGVFIADLMADEVFNHSYIVTKVLDTPSSIYKFITTMDQLSEFTSFLIVQYRNSGFDSISGGWINLPFAEDLSTFSSGERVQFKILFDTLSLDTSIPAQLQEFTLALQSNNEISDKWEYSREDSGSGVPSKVAFRLKQSYPTSVPELFFRAYDLNNILIANHSTEHNEVFFEISTNDGTTWSPKSGAIPNTVGTLLRYTFSVSPGVDIRPSLREA